MLQIRAVFSGTVIPFPQADRECKRYFGPGVYGSAPLEPPPPGLSSACLYRCPRLQVGSLALAGSKGGAARTTLPAFLPALPSVKVHLRFGHARQTCFQVRIVQPAAMHVDSAHTALLGGLGEPLTVLNHFAPSLTQELPVLLWSRGWGNPRYDPVLGVGRDDLSSLMAIVSGVSALLYCANTPPDHVP